MKTVFICPLDSLDDKNASLRAAIRLPLVAAGKQKFEVDTGRFSVVPGSPFAYWVSEGVRQIFDAMPSLGSSGRRASFGLSTKSDFRYVRLIWEIPPRQSAGWHVLAKGGAFGRYYFDYHLLIRWTVNGRELKAFADMRTEQLFGTPNWSRWINNWSSYFRPGLGWSRRSQRGLSVRAMPRGCIFSDKGPAAFVENDSTVQLLALLGVVNTSSFRALVELQMAFGSYEVGVIQHTPIPRLSPADESILATLAHHAWSLKRSLDTRTETSHAFTLPALLQVTGDTLAARVAIWMEHVLEVDAELGTIQAEIDDRCFDLYGIDETDRRAITEGFRDPSIAADDGDDQAADDINEEDELEASADSTTLVAELVSWAGGVAFGRFDVRLATGKRALPPEPEPFDPLPVCSPGMLTGEDGLPLAGPPANYPVDFPENGVLVDDPGHPRDLTTAVRAVFETVFGARADAMWDEAASLLDPKGHNLRTWLVSGFFEHHLKRHSKSRRKAPILWQLGVPSGRYSVWLYAHRLTPDSLFQLQNDVVGPKLAHEERQLAGMVQDAGPNPSAAERKQMASQDAFVAELRALLDEVKRVAPLWNPNLDDGVVLTMAPLWRLVPQHKSWQRELKSKWDELAAGDYDWAHLAIHLWPERVVPKCATDRSLAIAHELEDAFWAEDANGKWQPRPIPTRPVEETIRERTSSAVKAAVISLVGAPVAPGARRRRLSRIGRGE